MSRRARERDGARRAKRYQPGPVHRNMIERAMVGASRLPADDVERLRKLLDDALLAFGCGQQCQLNWNIMVDALAIAEHLAKLRICSDPDSIKRITGGQAALTAVHDRRQERGTWTLYAAERTALTEALWLHVVQLEHCSFSEYERAIANVRHAAQGALSGTPPAGCRVISGELEPTTTGATA